MNNNKMKWQSSDIASIAVALKSFMLKGYIVNQNLKLSEPEENLSYSAKLFYESLCNMVILNHISEMNGTQGDILGKRQKRQKGVTAAKLFLQDVNESYFNEWGGDITIKDIGKCKERQNKLKSEKIFMTDEETKKQKKIRLQKLMEKTIKMISEVVSLSHETDCEDIEETLYSFLEKALAFKS